ncbi:MAG TPA: serine dehydratase beta chain, partial [Bacillota bacterium]|nr:serine dehydratase beta chain [Bacillota bacterium]
MPGLFEVLGPIMIGPSSSHTAGAVRLGNIARSLLDEPPLEVHIYLHGSFAATYQGHGTDLALVGGLLGFSVDDDRLKRSFEYAKEQGMKVHLSSEDLGDVHP